MIEPGFFKSLFDISFSSFVTTKLVKVLYVITLVLIAVGYVVIAIAAFTSGGGSDVTIDSSGQIQESSGGGNSALGLLWLFILGPIWAFLSALFYRIFYELIIVMFRIMENTRDQLAIMRGHQLAPTLPATPNPPAPPAPGAPA